MTCRKKGAPYRVERRLWSESQLTGNLSGEVRLLCGQFPRRNCGAARCHKVSLTSKRRYSGRNGIFPAEVLVDGLLGCSSVSPEKLSARSPSRFESREATDATAIACTAETPGRQPWQAQFPRGN